MKLASYHDGSRDGQLIVVARDLGLAHYASHIANRLQQVLDDWNYLSPQLQDLYERLNQGRARHAFPFDAQRCLAPLPRAYQHVQARFGGDGLELLQCASDDLGAPCAPLRGSAADAGLECASALAVVSGDIPQGSTPARALEGVRLLLLGNSPSAGGTAANAQRLPCSFAPVALTPDELGSSWVQGCGPLPLVCHCDGRVQTLPARAAVPEGDFGTLLARLCQTRRLRAGSIVSAAALATLPLRVGERISIEMPGADGQSLFGSIAQELLALQD